MKCKFEVGQKVVHVPDWSGKFDNRAFFSDVTWPEPNGVYTISRLGEAFNPGFGMDIGLELLELGPQVTSLYGGGVCLFWFNHAEFQPLSFLDINISMFTEMLKPQKVDA